MSSFLKDVFVVGFGKMLKVGITLARGILTARWLGPEANGIIASLTLFPTLFMTFGSLGLSQSVTRYLGSGRYDEETIKRGILQVWILMSIVSFIACFALIYFLSSSGDNLLFIFCASIPIPFNLFNNYARGYFLGKNSMKDVSFNNWFVTLVGLISIIILIPLCDYQVEGVIYSLAIGPLVILALNEKKIGVFRKAHLGFDKELIKTLLNLGIVYAVTLLIINLNYKMDIFLLDYWSTSYQVGIYTKGVTISEVMWEIPALISAIIFARSASAKKGREYSLKVAQLLRICFVIIGVIVTILYIFASDIILALYGEQFFDSILVMQYVAPGILLLTIYKILNMDLAGKGKPFVALFAMVPALIINIILNYLWIPTMGAAGAAISTTISYSFAAVTFLIIYSKYVDIPIRTILHFKVSDFDPIVNKLKQLKKS